MDIDIKIRQISNAYYNLGLEKAKKRDLTGAAEALKKSLRFYKYQTDARNLLGLIYNEAGETGAALVQWIISLNLQETNNPADRYIYELRKSGGYIAVADQAVKKYNQALHYARNDNEDLAILLLRRMLDDFPQFVKAQALLALLYLHQEDYMKAGRCVYKALKIDRYNPVLQRYMDIVKQNTGRADAEKKKMKNLFSHRQMQDDDLIIPSSYKENTGLQSVLNILAGLAIGTAAVFFLVVPGVREDLNRNHNEALKVRLEEINRQNIALTDLRGELESVQAARDRAQEDLAAIETDTADRLIQYRNLALIQKYLEDNRMTDASVLYADTDWELLGQEESLSAVVSGIQSQMHETGYRFLEALGDNALEAGDSAKAIVYYQKSAGIRSDNLSAVYKLGQAYQAAGDENTANQYYGDLIMNHPDSEYAALAKQKRGY